MPQVMHKYEYITECAIAREHANHMSSFEHIMTEMEYGRWTTFQWVAHAPSALLPIIPIHVVENEMRRGEIHTHCHKYEAI